jgi:hypothetical protein
LHSNITHLGVVGEELLKASGIHHLALLVHADLLIVKTHPASATHCQPMESFMPSVRAVSTPALRFPPRFFLHKRRTTAPTNHFVRTGELTWLVYF